MRKLAALLITAALLSACGDTDDQGSDSPDTAEVAETNSTEAAPPSETEELFPDVVAAEAHEVSDGSWTFDVTLSSPYDSPERYADAWRVVAPDGTELGIRILGHDHAAEQPFTRSLAGVEIPVDVTTVRIEARDQVSGWGGATLELVLER